MVTPAVAIPRKIRELLVGLRVGVVWLGHVLVITSTVADLIPISRVTFILYFLCVKKAEKYLLINDYCCADSTCQRKYLKQIH